MERKVVSRRPACENNMMAVLCVRFELMEEVVSEAVAQSIDTGLSMFHERSMQWYILEETERKSVGVYETRQWRAEQTRI